MDDNIFCHSNFGYRRRPVRWSIDVTWPEHIQKSTVRTTLLIGWDFGLLNQKHIFQNYRFF